jgi:hypothetical protein
MAEVLISCGRRRFLALELELLDCGVLHGLHQTGQRLGGAEDCVLISAI